MLLDTRGREYSYTSNLNANTRRSIGSDIALLAFTFTRVESRNLLPLG